MHPFNEQLLVSARILIVEDDPIQREVLQLALVGCGYDVETSTDGLDAVWKIKDGCYDLVLLDYQLPEIDGLGVARLISELDETVERPLLLALTGNPDALKGRLGGLECAFADIVAKPISIPALIDKINRHLKAAIGRPSRNAGRTARLERHWAEYGVLPDQLAGEDTASGPARILVVEDDDLQQAVLRSVLEDRHYKVEVAADGLEAVRLIRAATFDLALVDYQIPEMDGLAVGRFILDLMNEDVRPRMLALTAAQDHLTTRQIETGNAFDDIIEKSSDYPALLASVDRHLRLSPRESTRRAAQFAAETAT